MGNQTSAENFFQEVEYQAAEGRLRRVCDYRHRLAELNESDFRNILNSVQWCYHHQRWRMVMGFVECLHDFFEEQSHWREGILYIKLALEASEALHEENRQLQWFFDLGLLHEQLGQLTEATNYYHLCLQMARQQDQTKLQADAIHQLGWLTHSQRNFSQAEALYLEAKSLREALDPADPLAISRSLHQLGLLAQDRGHYDQAKTYYETSLALRKTENEPYLIAASLHQLGALAVAGKEWDQAKDYFSQVLSLRRKLKDRAGEARALDQLGIIARQQQQWDAAYQCYLDSLKLKEQLGDGVGLIRAKLHLGEMYLSQRQLDRAKDWFQEGLRASQELKQAYQEGYAHLQLGLVSFYMSDYKEATAHYESSFQIFSDLEGLWREQAGVLYQLGLIANHQGQFDVARQKYLASLNIRECHGFKIEAGLTHLQLGMTYQAQDLYEAARQHYEAAYSIFKAEGAREYLVQAIYRLGNIAELSEQPEQACRYYRQTENLCRSYHLTPMRDLEAALHRVGHKCVKLQGEQP